MSRSFNSWEPRANLLCDELLLEFESKVRTTNNIHQGGSTQSESSNSESWIIPTAADFQIKNGSETSPQHKRSQKNLPEAANIFPCLTCLKKFKNRDSLLKHRQKHWGLICEKCNKTYTRESKLKMHLKNCR